MIDAFSHYLRDNRISKGIRQPVVFFKMADDGVRKIGAVQEGVLRRSFLRNGEYLDQVLWTVLEEDWRRAKVIWGGEVTLN